MMKSELRAAALAVCLAYCATPAFATDTATIQQSGSGGTAVINQAGNAGNADSVITQGGFGNTAAIDQSGIVQTDLAAGASARIDQLGNGNAAQLSQVGSDQQDASIAQTGDRNNATIHAQSGRAVVRVFQVGNDNGADLNFGPSASGLTVSETGNNNYARMSEHDGGFFDVRSAMNGDGNSAFVDVTGVGNTVLTQQSGDYNELHVTQDNPGLVFGNNTATITQSTSFNFASITQVGSAMNATIVQDTGNHNVATINQHF